MKEIIEQKKINSQKGTTLLELVVAVGIFIFLTILVNGIYVNIISSQKQTMAAQLTQESLRFVFEMMSIWMFIFECATYCAFKKLPLFISPCAL